MPAINITSPAADSQYFYESSDTLTATLCVAVSANPTLSGTSHPAACSNVLWFDTAMVDPSDVEVHESHDLRPFSIAGLQDVARVDTFVINEHSDTELETDFASNSATTIYPLATGCTTSVRLNSEDHENDVVLYAVVWDYTPWPESTSFDATSGVLSTPLTASVSVDIQMPSWIQIDMVSVNGGADEQIWNGKRFSNGDSLQIRSTTSNTFTNCGDEAGLNWYVSSTDDANFSSSTLLTACGNSAIFPLTADNKTYTVFASAASDSDSAHDSVYFNTNTNVGECTVDGVGYIHNDRSVAPTAGVSAISMGTLAGANDASINKFVNYIDRSTADDEANSSLSARRTTIVLSGAQFDSGLNDDTFTKGGLAFSEFFDAQFLSADVTLTNETTDVYGYFTQNNGTATVIVNCDTTKNSSVKVGISVNGDTVDEITKNQMNTDGNTFQWTGLNFYGGTANAPSPVAGTAAITVTDLDSGESATETFNIASTSGSTAAGTIGNTF